MRILHASLITLVIALLATVAGAQESDAKMAARFLKNGTVPAPPIDEPKIAPTKVKFLPWGDRICSVGFSNKVEMGIVGIVDRGVDLSEDLTAQQILEMGFAFGRDQCRPDGKRNVGGELYGRQVSVSLFPGDPATVTVDDIRRIFEAHRYEYQSTPPPPDKVYGVWDNDKPDLIFNYLNYPKALKEARAYYAQEARERNAALEQQRQAEQRLQSEIAARSAAFFKTNRVRHIVTAERLDANPFVYEGQVVALYGVFEQMTSATQGRFSSNNKFFVVSGVPRARFTQRKSVIILAGRVLGNIEVKLPGLGPTLVPHLSFVGSAFCQQPRCGDYALNPE